MSKRTHVGLSCGFAFYAAVGVSGAFAGKTPSDPDIDLAGGSKVELGDRLRDELVGGATIRIVGPDNDRELGTIMYDVQDNGLAPAHRWGGPR